MVTTLRGDGALSEEAAWSLAAPGRAGGGPLGAVMHAGAVLDPAVVTNISFRSVRAEYSGKVQQFSLPAHESRQLQMRAEMLKVIHYAQPAAD